MENLKNSPSNSFKSLTDIKEPFPSKIPHPKTCLDIFKKDPSTRTPEEITRITKYISNLRIFKRSLLSDPNPDEVLRLLTFYMKIETFPDETTIFHLEKPADKIYIIMQGKAKEFVPKTLGELDKEYKKTLRPSISNANTPRILQIKSTFSSNQEEKISSQNRRSDLTIPKISLPLPVEKTREVFTKKGSLRGLDPVEEEEKVKSNLTIQSKGSLTSKASRVKRTLRLDVRNRPSAILDSGPNSPLSQTSSNGNSPRSSRDPFRIILRESRTSRTISSSARGKRAYFSSITEDSIQTGQVEEESIPEEFRKNAHLYLMGKILKVKLRRLLQAGDFVGLDALEGNNLRSTALLTMKECVCVSLHRDDFFRVLRERKVVHKEKIEFFNQLFFERAEEEDITAFAMFWGDLNYRKHDIVFRQSDPADHVFLLYEGEVTLTRTVNDIKDAVKVNNDDVMVQVKKKNGGKEAIQYQFKIGVVGAGHIFGEKDFMNQEARTLTATVSSASAKLYRLSFQEYQSIRLTYAGVVSELLKKAAFQSSWKQERLNDFYQLNNLDRSRQHVFSDYLEHKKKAVESSPAYVEKFVKLKKPKIRPIDKSKLEPLLEYTKYCIPKPGKNCPDYLDDLVKEIRSKSTSTNTLHLPKDIAQSLEQSLNDPDDWFPFIKGKNNRLGSLTQRKESTYSQEASPSPSFKTIDNHDSTALIHRRKLTGSISGVDQSIFSPKRTPAQALPDIVRLNLENNPKILEKKTENQVSNEETSQNKTTIRIPRLQLEARLDNYSQGPPSCKTPSISLRSSPRIRIKKEKHSFNFDTSNMTNESSVYTPIAIKTMDKSKESSIFLTKKNKSTDSPPVSIYKGLSKFFPTAQCSPIRAGVEKQSYEDFDDAVGALSGAKEEKPFPKLKLDIPLGILNIEKGGTPRIYNPSNHRRNRSGNPVVLSKFVVEGQFGKVVKCEPLSARGDSLDILMKVRSQISKVKQRPYQCQ